MPRLNVKVKDGFVSPWTVAGFEFTSEAREVDVDDAVAETLRASTDLDVADVAATEPAAAL